MSDWEIVNNVPMNEPSQEQSDWEIVPKNYSNDPLPEESVGTSLLKAGPRLYEDAMRAGMGAIKSIPGYMESAKTEIPGAFQAIANHPGHAAMQGLAGTQELINNLAQLPKSLAQYGNQRLNLIPNSAVNAISSITPENTTDAINRLFGQPKYVGENLIRGVGRNAINLHGLGKAGSILNPLNLNAKNIAKDIVKTGEKNKKIYSSHYSNLWNEAANYGINDLSHILPSIDINTLRKYSPKTKIEGVEDFINHPTLENAHRAKSDLLAMDRKMNGLTTMNSGEIKHSRAIKNAINDIQDNMFKNSRGEINPDLLNKYRTIQNGYATEVVPYKNKAINKYKSKKMTAKELVNSLSRGEFAAMRGKYHPAMTIRNMIQDHPYLTATGLGGLGLMTYKDLMGNSSSEFNQ